MNKWYLTVGNKSKPKLLESYYTLTHDNYDVTFSERELEPGRGPLPPPSIWTRFGPPNRSLLTNHNHYLFYPTVGMTTSTYSH